MISWGVVAVLFLVLGGPALLTLALATSQSAKSGDLSWRIDRLERKLDAILSHLGIAHDDHVPEIVVGLTRAGRKIEAIREYRKLTGASLVVAKREVEFLLSKFEGKAGQPVIDEP